jgi:hypothetical protein
MRFKPIGLSLDAFNKEKSVAFNSAQKFNIHDLLSGVPLDENKNLIIVHGEKEFLLPYMRALTPASIKNICKSILSGKIKYGLTAKYLSEEKKSGQVVFYKPEQNDPPLVMSMPCLYNLLFKGNPITCTNSSCKKKCKFVTQDLDELNVRNIQLNRGKTVIPIAEMKQKGLIEKLRAVVLKDYNRSKDDIEKILDTPTNIGKLSDAYMKGANNVFRLFGFKRVARKCGRSVLSPSPDDWVYLPVEMFRELFCYDETCRKYQKEYCYVIRYPITMYMQVLLFKCRPWNGKTIKMPTWALKLYNGDFDGDQVEVIPICEQIAVIHAILDTSILFNMYTGQVNLHAPPSALLYTDIENYSLFVTYTIQEGLITGNYGSAVDIIMNQLNEDYKKCNESTECVSIRDLLTFQGIVARLPRATRFSRRHVEQLTHKIGKVTGVLSKESTIINSNYLRGIDYNELFDAAIHLREGIIASKVTIPDVGDQMTAKAFVTPTLIVEDGFFVTYMEQLVSLTPLNMLCNIVEPRKDFLGLCIEEFDKLYL